MIEIQMNEAMRTLKNLTKKELYDLREELAKEAYDRCKNYYVPVDTEELRDSIYYEITNDGFYLGANARHSVFNEYGSIRTPIGSIENPRSAVKKGFRPFIRPALYEIRNKHPEMFRKKWSELISHG